MTRAVPDNYGEHAHRGDGGKRGMETVFGLGLQSDACEIAPRLGHVGPPLRGRIHAHYIAEEQLDAAIQYVINAYNHFAAIGRLRIVGRSAYRPFLNGTIWLMAKCLRMVLRCPFRAFPLFDSARLGDAPSV